MKPHAQISPESNAVAVAAPAAAVKEKPKGWTQDELLAAVNAYLYMARLQADGQPFNKREIYRALSAEYGRSRKSYEFRMMNISAVYEDMGYTPVVGLRPARHLGKNIYAQIKAMLELTL